MSRLAAVLGAAWGLLVFANAVSAHPLNPDWVWRFFWPPVGEWSWARFLAAQERNLLVIAVVAVFDLGCWAAGRGALALVGAGRIPGIAGAGIAAAAGMALCGAAAAALGLAGLAYPGCVGAIPLVALLCVRRVRGVPAGAGTPGIPVPFALIGAVLIAAGLLGALAPEVSTDALRHWVEAPRRAFLLHRLAAPERWPLGWLPVQPVGENMCVAALAGDLPVRVLAWQAWVLVAAILVAWDAKWGAAAAVCWLAGLNHSVLAQLGWTDTRAAAWVLLAGWAQFRARRGVLAGLAWGAAVATKPQAGIFLAAAVAGQALGGSPAKAARMLAASAVPMLPWLARNWVGAGHAFAPVGGGTLSAFFLQQRAWLRHESATAILAAPFEAAARTTIWDGLLSPLLVVLLPLAAVAPGAGLKWTVALAVAGWAWTAGYAGRYLLPAAPLLLAAAASGAARIDAPRRVRVLVLAAVAVAAAWEGAVSLAFSFFVFNPAGVAEGRETPSAYLARVLTPRPATWEARGALRRRVPPAAPLYVSGCGDAHYWPGVPVLEAEGLAPPLAVWAEGCASPARLRIALRQRGIEWLVDEDTGAALIPGLLPDFAAWTPRALRVWRGCLGRWGAPVAVVGDAHGRYVLWHLESRPHPPIDLPRRLPGTGPA